MLATAPISDGDSVAGDTTNPHRIPSAGTNWDSLCVAMWQLIYCIFSVYFSGRGPGGSTPYLHMSHSASAQCPPHFFLGISMQRRVLQNNATQCARQCHIVSSARRLNNDSSAQQFRT